MSTKGFDEYLEKIGKAGQDIDQITDQALIVGGKILVDGMQARAPELTGNLKSKIHATEPIVDGNYHFIEVGLPSDVDAETARYGNTQEFGSSSMAAHPYVRPALNEDMNVARSEMKNVFTGNGAL